MDLVRISFDSSQVILPICDNISVISNKNKFLILFMVGNIVIIKNYDKIKLHVTLKVTDSNVYKL